MTVALIRPGTRPAVSGGWLLAAVATVGMAAGLLVLTADLGVTDRGLRHGVGGMDRLVALNDVAVDGATALVPTQAAVDRSNVQVAGMVDSLGRAVGALDRMSADMSRLSTSLAQADQPLAGVLASVGRTSAATTGAQASVARTSTLLAQADETARTLRPLLDEAATRAAAIERKLRVLRLLPVGAP